MELAEIKHERPRKQKATIHTVRASSPDKSKAKFTCVLCNGDKHGLYLCTTFKGMSVYAKNNHIKTAKLCFNCLGYGHRTKEFRHAARSVPGMPEHLTLQEVYHTLLHKDYLTVSPETQSTETPPSTDQAVVNVIAPQKLIEPKACLLMTSQVVVQAPSGRTLVARALLDMGATTSLISNCIVQGLKLPKSPCTVIGRSSGSRPRF